MSHTAPLATTFVAPSAAHTAQPPGGMDLSLLQAALWLGAADDSGRSAPSAVRCLSPAAHDPAQVRIARVHTDSRSLQAGDLFVALRGERFDGNQFIAQAKAQGAVAVVCEASGEAEAAAQGLPALVVPDARMALGELAAGWRAQFDLPVIAVTGSNGTTYTSMALWLTSSPQPQR